jgi:hypothetical protein
MMLNFEIGQKFLSQIWGGQNLNSRKNPELGCLEDVADLQNVSEEKFPAKDPYKKNDYKVNKPDNHSRDKVKFIVKYKVESLMMLHFDIGQKLLL